MEFDSDDLPVFGASYVSAMHSIYMDGRFDLSEVVHNEFTQGYAPPEEGETTIHRFDSRVTANVRMFDRDPVRVEARADCTVSVAWAGQQGNVRTFNAQMVQLDVKGVDNLGAARLRVSPTLPSKGVTTIEKLPNGLYKIESYFDIYTELSVDSGAYWFPSETGAVRMMLVEHYDAPALQTGVLVH